MKNTILSTFLAGFLFMGYCANADEVSKINVKVFDLVTYNIRLIQDSPDFESDTYTELVKTFQDSQVPTQLRFADGVKQFLVEMVRNDGTKCKKLNQFYDPYDVFKGPGNPIVISDCEPVYLRINNEVFSLKEIMGRTIQYNSESGSKYKNLYDQKQTLFRLQDEQGNNWVITSSEFFLVLLYNQNQVVVGKGKAWDDSFFFQETKANFKAIFEANGNAKEACKRMQGRLGEMDGEPWLKESLSADGEATGIKAKVYFKCSFDRTFKPNPAQ